MAIDYRITLLSKEPDPMFLPDRPPNPALANLYRVNLDSTNIPREISGIEKLCQRIVMVMLGTPGTDIWDPGKGGGLIRLSKKSWSVNTDDLRNQASMVVFLTNNQILTEQRLLSLPPAETLEKLQLSKIRIGNRILEPIEIDQPRMTCEIRPTVISRAGEKAIFTLGMELQRDLGMVQ